MRFAWLYLEQFVNKTFYVGENNGDAKEYFVNTKLSS